jgi:3-hydroxyisobutyrate dehydrogenase-like beta-hydroxyacid dehydrogenase
MDIGFVGLGNMGKGIAQSLIGAGHRLRVWNRSSGPAQELVKRGAELMGSPREAFGGDAFVSMLADDRALRQVLLDGDVLPDKGGKTVHVCMATISVGFARELTELHRARKIPFISAPVLGRPDVAAAGKLAILAAGDPKIVERVQPLLDAAGRKTWYFGDQPRNANLVKIAANFMLASAIETIAEARALVEANDIPADQFLSLITSTLFDAPVYKGYGAIIGRRQYEPAGFKLALGFKDLRLALAAAEAAHVPLPFASILRDNFLDAIAHGDEAKDWSAVAEVAMRHAGLVTGRQTAKSG